MKRGVVGGIAVCLLCAASWSVPVDAVAVYVNDAPILPTRPILVEGGSVLVPMAEFGRAVGIDTTAEAGRLVLHWAGAHRSIDIDRCAVRDGEPYIGLDWLVGLVGGEVHRVGDAWYVETELAALVDLEVTEERVILRFNAFVPIAVEASDDGTAIRLQLHHCTSTVGAQWIVPGEGGVESVRVPAPKPGIVDVRIALRDGMTFRTETVEFSGFYSYALQTAEQPGSETTVRIDDGLDLHGLEAILSTGPIRANWLYVEAWRDRYRLVPALAASGVGTVAPLETLAEPLNAVAAINLGCGRDAQPLDLLVIGGVPYVAMGAIHCGLALDIFGTWAYCSGPASLFGQHEACRIAIDDVNRPLQYGEVIAYPPGYVGEIARGVPGSFIVIKVRSGRVVSVYEGPFVSADSSATLLVASGEAKGRLSLVRLGDRVSLACGLGEDTSCYAHAFTAGPILVDSGIVVEEPLDAAGSASAWSILATDWHGGLILLSFVRESGTEAEALADLTALLRSMPVPIRDAIVVGRCSGTTLVVRDTSSALRLGSGEPYAVALCLTPLAP